MKKRIAVFLDRDGTLNQEAGYIRELKNLVLENGAAEAVQKLNSNKLLAILVTNQTGAARNYYPEQHILDLNLRLKELLKNKDAYLDAYYYCPHYKDGIVNKYSLDCNCRKPNPGLIYYALKDFPEIDLQNSYVVGDKATDVDLAYNVNAKSILLKTGFGQRVLDGTYQELKQKPHYIATNILDAVDWILKDIEKQKT